ncbi:hypothetical protein [Roseibium polysiphoniae]|uniref:GIY-YIG domain-containing protein n=1 Tax=Roseibium polysiphoniae TaxID=2571221 RepID=A0ABR9CFR5_9HYPH|nr:hypothetical protein [Roseibium polysiphoniae]MBD8878488.1 hypothetical protein [Roseibium polysiphoniae]
MEHRRHAPDCNPPLDGLDYSSPRPFSMWKSGHLDTLIGGWLQLQPPCLELATLALEELTIRREDLQARMKFANADLEPIVWLADARRSVRDVLLPDIQETAPKSSARGKVYVILRGGYTETNLWYGAYVGSTTRPIGKRFAEHRAGGPRSARGLPTHGIEPLYSLFAPLNPVASSRGKLREWETRLHECLAPIVPKVTGDVAF